MLRLRRLLFFFLQRAIGSHAGACYRQFRIMEHWTPERLAAWQAAQVHSVLVNATENIPLYRERRLAPRLDAFPIVTKELLADRYRDFMRSDLRQEYESGRRPHGYGWLEVTSGGTTGVPTTVIHDAGFRDQDRAARLYEHDLSGFPFGTPHARLWGSMHDIQHTRDSTMHSTMQTLSGAVTLNAFQMEDRQIESYLDQIRTQRLDYAISYVDAAFQMALHARARGLSVRPLKDIMVTGGTLTEHVRQTLHDVFGARIHNKYGSRDAGELACECEAGGLHVLSPNVLIEILDEAGRTLPPGERGRIVVTVLSNGTFPMIRFDITDIAARREGICPCGRPFPLLDQLEGRASDFMYSASGGFVSPVYVRHVVGVVHGQGLIRRFQFVQNGLAEFHLLIQPAAGASPEALQRIVPPLERDLRAVFGATAALRIDFVQRIPETARGKFQYTINRYRPMP